MSHQKNKKKQLPCIGDGSGGVCFVYCFFKIVSNIKILVISALIHILCKSPKQIFPSITKKIDFFRYISKIF